MSDELTAQPDFDEISTLITNAKQRAVQAANVALVDLYWQVGKYIHEKITSAQWGDGVVNQLARHLKATQPGLRGFTERNLFRMRQFYVTYRDSEKVSPLVTQLPWTHNMIIVSQSKTAAEREFYVSAAVREKWTKRELERQFKGALFERTVLHPAKVSPAVRQSHPQAETLLKDAYLLEFLDLPAEHQESDLQSQLPAVRIHGGRRMNRQFLTCFTRELDEIDEELKGVTDRIVQMIGALS